MKEYAIYIVAPIDLRHTLPRNARRGEKCIRVKCTREELAARVAELKVSGEVVKSVVTALGYDVRF